MKVTDNNGSKTIEFSTGAYMNVVLSRVKKFGRVEEDLRTLQYASWEISQVTVESQNSSYKALSG